MLKRSTSSAVTNKERTGSHSTNDSTTVMGQHIPFHYQHPCDCIAYLVENNTQHILKSLFVHKATQLNLLRLARSLDQVKLLVRCAKHQYFRFSENFLIKLLILLAQIHNTKGRDLVSEIRYPVSGCIRYIWGLGSGIWGPDYRSEC